MMNSQVHRPALARNLFKFYRDLRVDPPIPEAVFGDQRFAQFIRLAIDPRIVEQPGAHRIRCKMLDRLLSTADGVLVDWLCEFVTEIDMYPETTLIEARAYLHAVSAEAIDEAAAVESPAAIYGMGVAEARELLAFLDGLDPNVCGPHPAGLAVIADRLEAALAQT